MAEGKSQLCLEGWCVAEDTRARLVSVTLRDQVTVEVGADAVGVGHEGRLKLSQFVTRITKIFLGSFFYGWPERRIFCLN